MKGKGSFHFYSKFAASHWNLTVKTQLLHSHMPLKRVLIRNYWNTSAVGVRWMSCNKYCCSHATCYRSWHSRAWVHHPVVMWLFSHYKALSYYILQWNYINKSQCWWHDVWSNDVSMHADPSSYHWSYYVSISFSNFSKEEESQFLPEYVVLSYAFF